MREFKESECDEIIHREPYVRFRFAAVMAAVSWALCFFGLWVIRTPFMVALATSVTTAAVTFGEEMGWYGPGRRFLRRHKMAHPFWETTQDPRSRHDVPISRTRSYLYTDTKTGSTWNIPPEYPGDVRDPAAGCWFEVDPMLNSSSQDPIHCRKPCVPGTRYCFTHQKRVAK